MPSVQPSLLAEALARLAERNPGRTEADIQADVRDVLLHGGFDLGEEHVRLESPAPDRKRIDVDVGALVIECKRDLRPRRVLKEAEEQLAGYLVVREESNDGIYVGVLTDGVAWRCYRSAGDSVTFVSEIVLRSGQIDERRFRWWLGALIATERHLTPTAESIEERLGSESPGCQLILCSLHQLWARAGQSSEVSVKRALWAKLLRTALGTQFQDDDALFVEHTYLVLVANLIAHAVVGFTTEDIRQSQAIVLSGALFARSGIRGVGEAGFFDWVLDVPGGDRIVTSIAEHLAVFAWSGVDHDVLKALYQSVISPETRHRLGEYYTPDWLAKRIVAEVVTDPLSERVLDPACGSGTFLFHAVRHYLSAAEARGVGSAEAVAGVTDHVFGMDLHPVAVVLAQVTYLLAIGTDLIGAAEITVPVYLGDSMRWEMGEDSFISPAGEVLIPVSNTGSGQGSLLEDGLRFPSSVVANPARFDKLVDELATRAAKRAPGSPPLPIRGILSNLGVSRDDRHVLEDTYKRFCVLHDERRNHIWGFYVRNQARPTWFTMPENRVDVLIGNPPWLSYRYMPAEMQTRFRERATERHLWAGGKVATHQDLSAYFVARSVELYLRVAGRFGFVMPLAALSRQAYAGFRAANFSSRTHACAVAFDTPWDLDGVAPDPFPVPASVVLGKRVAHTAKEPPVALPVTRQIVAGRVNGGDGSGSDLVWASSMETAEPVYEQASSPYAERFRQGATLSPRMLLLVEEEPPGPMPLLRTQRAVRSRRGRLDKAPWRDIPDHTGVVESIFLRPVYMGEHVLPFRLLAPAVGVIPRDRAGLMHGQDERIDRYEGLAEWWRGAERIWDTNKGRKTELSLLGQVDYYGKFSAQFPTPDIRVVYTKAGNYLTAAVVMDNNAVVDHTLYWGTTATLDEARYLTAVLNSPALGIIIEPYQSRGAFGARHFDKYVWYPPIPEYDPILSDHRRLALLGEQAEELVAQLDLDLNFGFQRIRRTVREALTEAGVLAEIDSAVLALLGR